MDRRTLFSMQAGLLIFLGGVILLAFRRNLHQRRDRGSTWFAAAYFCAGVGLALQSERGIIPPFLSILLGNFLFLMFGVLANHALVTSTGQRSNTWKYLLALNLATISNFAYYTYWQPNLVLRVVEASLVIVVVHISLIGALLRVRESIILPATRSMAVLLALHALGLTLLSFAVGRHFRELIFSWIGIITIAGLALGYLWMDNLRLHAILERSAMTDPLTGLYNRRALDSFVKGRMDDARRRNRPCSALMLDIDYFKIINDELGHAAGDSSLSAVAAALQACIRSSDIATRLGGDEFFILLPDADESIAELVKARIRHAIDTLQMRTMGGHVFSVSASVGTVTRHGQMTVEDLLHGSDIMLYREKQLNRARMIDPARIQSGGAQVQPSNA
jgi:diguanylate cyclase (GGDEF)-like protein